MLFHDFSTNSPKSHRLFNDQTQSLHICPKIFIIFLDPIKSFELLLALLELPLPFLQFHLQLTELSLIKLRLLQLQILFHHHLLIAHLQFLNLVL